MTVVPYLYFDASARDALTFYQSVFGGDIELHTYAEFGRDDGPADAIAHGMLRGTVGLYGTDAGDGEATVGGDGIVLALLGTAEASIMQQWFAALTEGGTVDDPLQQRPWGAHDGRVTDLYGVSWLIGYED